MFWRVPSDPGPVELPVELMDLLFLQWVHIYASGELGTTQYGQSGSDWNFLRQPDNAIFTLKRTNSNPRWRLEVGGGFAPELVERLVRRAADSVDHRDMGEPVCYRGELVSDEPTLNGTFATQFARLLGDQVAIAGWRRLSANVLLEFIIDEPHINPSLFVPRTRVRTFIFTPGTLAGPMSDRLARDTMEMVRLICTLAAGRVFEGGGVSVFPADADSRVEAEGKRFDFEGVLTLARDGTSLDPLTDLATIAGPSFVAKYRNSLVAFDAALRQVNPDVATILFVSGLEALFLPDAPWSRRRPVARFIRATLEYSPEAVDALLGHANVAEALGFVPRGGLARQRRQVMDCIYQLRSAPVHAGPGMAFGFMDPASMPAQMRVALLSELHWKVLLAFLRAPRSSLIGHPSVAPGDIETETAAE